MSSFDVGYTLHIHYTTDLAYTSATMISCLCRCISSDLMACRMNDVLCIVVRGAWIDRAALHCCEGQLDRSRLRAASPSSHHAACVGFTVSMYISHCVCSIIPGPSAVWSGQRAGVGHRAESMRVPVHIQHSIVVQPTSGANSRTPASHGIITSAARWQFLLFLFNLSCRVCFWRSNLWFVCGRDRENVLVEVEMIWFNSFFGILLKTVVSSWPLLSSSKLRLTLNWSGCYCLYFSRPRHKLKWNLGVFDRNTFH